jgi:undecaprenyl pyrophosphate synthase
MQLEAAHAVEITKLVENVDRKEDPLIKVVRTHQHNTDSAVLQTARRLKTEVQRETRKMKDSKAKKKNGTVRGCMDYCQVAEMKNWWILNSHIAG